MKTARKTGNHDPGPLPLSATYCRHCNQGFPQAVPIIGHVPGSEFHDLMMALSLHLGQKHPDLMQARVQPQVLLAAGMSAHLMLNEFTTTDEGLIEWRDRQRHNLLRFALRAPVSDETIESKIGEVFELWATQHPDDAEQLKCNVVALFKSMRDAIEERNLYPEPVHLVQPGLSVV